MPECKWLSEQLEKNIEIFYYKITMGVIFKIFSGLLGGELIKNVQMVTKCAKMIHIY